MTSRINARHITCPGCQEEVFLDELVGGQCPLCGCTLEEIDDSCDEFEEGLDRSDLAWLIFHYFVFRKFDTLGANPYQIMQLIARYEDAATDEQTPEIPFTLQVKMQSLDRILPKRCSKCGRIFFRGGKKRISGELSSPVFTVQYTCPDC